MRPELLSTGLTHIGRRRHHNEDAIHLSDEAGLYLVADGMGGHALGEVASALVIEAVSQYLASERVTSAAALAEAVKRANRRVHEYATQQVQAQEAEGTLATGMGTTIVALLIHDESAFIAHVGDSRAYRLRDNRLEVLTRDHSLAAMASAQHGTANPTIRTGFKNILMRAIGVEPEVEVDLREEKLKAGDLFLLCSDGLTNMVPDERIQDILTSDPSLQAACETLVQEANHNGGRDNISCVLVRLDPSFKSAQ